MWATWRQGGVRNVLCVDSMHWSCRASPVPGEGTGRLARSRSPNFAPSSACELRAQRVHVAVVVCLGREGFLACLEVSVTAASWIVHARMCQLPSAAYISTGDIHVTRIGKKTARGGSERSYPVLRRARRSRPIKTRGGPGGPAADPPPPRPLQVRRAPADL